MKIYSVQLLYEFVCFTSDKSPAEDQLKVHKLSLNLKIAEQKFGNDLRI